MDMKSMLQKSIEFNENWKQQIGQGFKDGLVLPYPLYFIEHLRSFYYENIPMSIIILCQELCNGNCYDTATLIAATIESEDYCIVEADIDGIKYNPKVIDEVDKKIKQGKVIDEHYANHCFLEVKANDMVWVIDASIGLIIEKGLYYSLQNPVITKIINKENAASCTKYKHVEQNLISIDKALSTLQFFEEMAKYNNKVYKDLLLEEIKIFKEQLDTILSEETDTQKILIKSVNCDDSN